MNKQQYQEMYYDKFHNLLSLSINRGQGLHRHLFAICCAAVKAGVSMDDTRGAVKARYSSIRPGEVEESYRNAEKCVEPFEERGDLHSIKGLTPVALKVEFDKELETSDLLNISPVKIGESNEKDSKLFITTLFREGEYVFMGSGCDTNIFTREDWLQGDTSKYEFVGSNPYSGEIGETKGGKFSYRADACISSYRHCVAEMDNLPLNKQVFFWYNIIKENFLDVVSIVFSGSKSLHALIKVNLGLDLALWEKDIKNFLYKECLCKYGCDIACCNVGRMTRNAGYYREDKKAVQKLLYLNNKL